MNELAKRLRESAFECIGVGIPVLALYGVRDGHCGCGKPNCRDAGKHPHKRYAPHGCYSSTRDMAEVHSWPWGDEPLNIGMPTGKASGHLVVDVDTKRCGEKSLEALGPIPATIMARTGGGGIHLHFKMPDADIRNNQDYLGKGIDVCGNGGLVVNPRSIHICGKAYEWISGPREQLADPPESILTPLLAKASGSSPSLSREPEAILRVSASSVLSVLSALSGNLSSEGAERSPAQRSEATERVSAKVQAAIERTLPESFGNRNACIFAFARRLKAIPELAEQPLKDLRPLVELWHAAAYPNIATKPFSDTWADFVHGWKRVKWPEGAKLGVAVHLAREDVAQPPEASLYHDPRVQLLVRICWQLQQLHGDEPLYLAQRTAGEILEVTGPTAGKWLEMLMVDGYLVIAEAHTNLLATRYRYIGKPSRE